MKNVWTGEKVGGRGPSVEEQLAGQVSRRPRQSGADGEEGRSEGICWSGGERQWDAEGGTTSDAQECNN